MQKGDCVMELWCGDCLELMKDIPDNSIDMVLCDLPYGTTQCEWDVKLPFEPLWAEYKRIVKENGAILLFAQQPFETDLINSNRKMFRYEWVWEKSRPMGFLNANKMPLRAHENICVFYRRLPLYNPQKTEATGKPRLNKCGDRYSGYGKYVRQDTWDDGSRYPRDVIRFAVHEGRHAAQKPVELCEYLIKTYTNEGEVVLDNCMGSGSTGVACVNCGREFIGIEKDAGFFEIARSRIEEARKAFNSVECGEISECRMYNLN